MAWVSLPSAPTPSSSEDQTIGPPIPTGGRFVSPALELVRTAAELKRLDELTRPPQAPADPQLARDAAALASLVAIARRDVPASETALKALRPALESLPADSPPSKRYAEYVVAAAALDVPELRSAALPIIERLALDQQKSQQQAAQKAAAEKLAADQLAEQQKAQAAEQQKERPTHSTQPAGQSAGTATKPAAGAEATAATGSATGGETSDAVLVKGAAPDYPPSALRAHESGWVVVSFSIRPDGKTDDIHVVDAQPRRVFDRAAMDTVRRYQFKPAMKDGVAVSTTRQLKIEFNL